MSKHLYRSASSAEIIDRRDDTIERHSFKSRGEREIAGFLEGQDIDYQYEYPLAIVDQGKTRIWYPDFRLPQYDTIIEYFGMNGNRSYNEQMAHKMRVFHQAGINGIYLLESTMRGDWQSMILERIEQVLEGKFRKIQRLRRNMTPQYQMAG